MSTDAGKDTVISALESFSQRTQEISSRIDGRSRLNPFETGDLQALYGELKSDVRAASKRGKVEDGKHDQTDWERYYFAPAMRKAAISLRARSNTNPITSNWLSSLLDAGMEFSYHLHQLQKMSLPNQ
jgi:hypothetical protein